MNRYNGILGIVAIITLLTGFIVPQVFISPTPISAGVMEWTPVSTPDITAEQIDSIYSPVDPANIQLLEQGSEIIKLLVGANGLKMYALVRAGYWSGSTVGNVSLLSSNDGGRTWFSSGLDDNITVFDVAVALDDFNAVIAAVSTKPAPGIFSFAQEIWYSSNGARSWDDLGWNPPSPGAYVSAVDISMDFGNGRYIMVGTRPGDGAQTYNIQTIRTPGFGGWRIQDATNSSLNPFTGDVIAAKFSPTFIGDSSVVVVYSDIGGTHLLTGSMDIFANRIDWSGAPIELKNAAATAGTSPDFSQIWGAHIEMPSDFSGQTASLRRIYVSTATSQSGKNHGIYRVDDTVVYTLMDNTNIVNKQIYSIAYWGTYASGKLLAGEHFGYECTATVPTWFTDSPTVCPIPCWYPAKKPATGAAGMETCTVNLRQYGNAYVAWSPVYADQGVAYVGTGVENWGPFATPTGNPVTPSAPSAAQLVGVWPAGILTTPVPLDESAFALTRNNGATWNELSLIDTRIAKLTDFAISPDCTTMYLASVNNANGCKGFDSVWRSSSNEKVIAPPLPVLPLGDLWERVLTHVTATSCNLTQSNYAILRLAQDKTDGQVVFWAAGGTSGLSTIWSGCSAAPANDVAFTVGSNTKAVEWSPDFGDFWGDIRPRLEVQDMAAPSSTVLYVVDTQANSQKLPYTGTAWSSASATVYTKLQGAHTIEAVGANDVIVGGSNASSWVAAYSSDAGLNFMAFTAAPPAPPVIGYHMLFDTDFATTKTVFEGEDGMGGHIRRNRVDSMGPPFTSLMTLCGGHTVGYFGLAQTNSKNVSSQGTLYGAHRPVNGCDTTLIAWSGVERTLRPLDGVPKPCVEWDCLDASPRPYQAFYPWFTLEPKSLKLCGCLTQDTNTNLYAIDNDWYSGNNQVDMGMGNAGTNGGLGDRGRLWVYTDCVAKTGPKLTMADNTIIGCDPATGRNQEVNFTWEQLCIATTYELHIDKAKAMNLPVFSGFVIPYDVTSPSLIYLAGGEGIGGGILYADLSSAWNSSVSSGVVAGLVSVPSLECGHTYYWKVRVRDEVTADVVRSPWSEIRAFTIKAGFKVTTPYYGPQLLTPDNGCGCACSTPISFSWSPYKETTEYKFELSTNADMSSPTVSTTVKNATAYQWTSKPKCNTSYFWRVMATAPAPSEWSATFTFRTQDLPAPPAPENPEPGTPIWVWVITGLGAFLVILTLALILQTRR